MLISFAPIGSVVDAWHVTENTPNAAPPDDTHSRRQSRKFTVKRYGAYFKGWCQVFGEHESILVGERENCWLIGENKIGLILPKPTLRQLNGEVLLHEQMPTILFSRKGVQIGSLEFPFKNDLERKILEVLGQLADAGSDLHLFMTSHLLYGNGSRIISISNKKPQSIIYREIGDIEVCLQ